MACLFVGVQHGRSVVDDHCTPEYLAAPIASMVLLTSSNRTRVTVCLICPASS